VIFTSWDPDLNFCHRSFNGRVIDTRNDDSPALLFYAAQKNEKSP
jgi:hypothetical protein